MFVIITSSILLLFVNFIRPRRWRGRKYYYCDLYRRCDNITVVLYTRRTWFRWTRNHLLRTEQAVSPL